VLRFAHLNPAVVVVIDHLGGLADSALSDSYWMDGMQRMSSLANVKIKVSGWRTPIRAGIADEIRFVADVFGPERLLFGTDWPMAAPSGAYADVVGTTRELLSWLGRRDLDRVMRANAWGLYRFARRGGRHEIGETG
jgi:L-fuconolactonase